MAERRTRRAEVAVWVIVPARMGSRRLPGKALADLGGVPLVEHVRRRACGARGVERVTVATDSERIAEVVRAHGGEAVLTGPAPSGTHRVALAAEGHAGPVINVQGDLPLLDPRDVERIIAILEQGAPVATLAAPWPEDADPADRALVKVGPGPVFTRSPIPEARLHVGIYGFGPGVIARAAAAPPSGRSVAEDLEQLAWLDAGLSIRVGSTPAATPGVDTPAQLAALRARWVV